VFDGRKIMNCNDKKNAPTTARSVDTVAMTEFFNNFGTDIDSVLD
jgi:hypothetical protein